MKTKTISSILLFIGITVTSIAQVKIGNNPNAINANSLLELESTNRGFLPPRMPLNSINTVSPLTGTVPEAMQVYSSGGSLQNGLYTWNGSQWMRMLTSADARNNFVIVQSTANLPAPVGGVITLVSGTMYQINGTITLSSQINLNGCKIAGLDAVNDKLVYTGTSSLFTGSTTGSIEFLTLTAASGSVFNISASGAAENLILENSYIVGCSSVGTIQGVGGTCYFSNVAYFYNTNGVTFQNDSIVLQYNLMWDVSNHNTYEKYIGKFSVVQIMGGGREVSSTNSATGLNISGITGITNGDLKVALYVGTGTYVTGTFSNNWEVEADNLTTQEDAVATGNVYLTSAASTSFTAANTPTKISGTTTSTDLFRVTSPSSNRLTYAGRKTRTFRVIAAVSGSPGGSSQVYDFYIAKNGVIVSESLQEIKLTNTTDEQSATISCDVSMAPNDYIEVWVKNTTSTSALTVQSLNLSVL